MKRTTFNILFLIKKSRELKNGESPIFLRITVNGERTETTIKRNIKTSLWDSDKSKAKGNSEESKEINDYLNSIRGQLYTHQKNLLENNKEVSAKSLTNAFLGIGEKKWKLVELFKSHNQQMQKLVGIDFAPLTLQRYQAGLKHVEIFTKNEYNSADLFLNEVDHKYIKSFEFYLKTTAKCQHNSAMKHMKALKKIINLAIAQDYIRKDPFASYQICIKNTKRDHLTESELTSLKTKEITIERLDLVRDLFLVQCYTGLAYVDLLALSKENIQIGIDGLKWIFIERTKTKTDCRIPLFSIVEEIINKYRNHPIVEHENKLLPVISNQKMNAYLKEIATICDINSSLSSHCGRHTFASTVTLANGVPMETVSRLLGHSKISTTQIYSRVTESKISDDTNMLRVKLVV